MSAEQIRLEESRNQQTPWKKWGPYLSERQWGTVREDYSEGGDAWNYFSHDQARSRAYRWGEDGLAGISDDQQRLCFALALWNGKDPILKERLFGLTNSESNHGEDVKEYYFYLDSTPTHSYMKYLYKYPQAAFPYADLVETSRRRSRAGVRVRTARHRRLRPGSLLRRLRRVRQGVAGGHPHPDQRPQPRPGSRPSCTSCRRSGSATSGPGMAAPTGRRLQQVGDDSGPRVVKAVDPKLGERYLYCEGDVPLLFTENETNTQRIFGVPNRSPYVKDSINNYIVHGQAGCREPGEDGNEGGGPLSPDGRARRVPGGSAPAQRRRAGGAGTAQRQAAGPFGSHFDEVAAGAAPGGRRVLREPSSPLARRRRGQRHAPGPGGDALEQAVLPLRRGQVAGRARLRSRSRRSRKAAPRNDHWHHMYNGDVISMPDKWEYPWYAAWDLAFHVLALTLVDPDFGKQQLKLMLRERYMHPNGQIPAYEWNFGDVNPPVHAWSTIFTYRLEKAQTGRGRQGLAQELLPEAAA